MEIRIKDGSAKVIFTKGTQWVNLEIGSGPGTLYVHSSESPIRGFGIADETIYDFLKNYIKNK